MRSIYQNLLFASIVLGSSCKPVRSDSELSLVRNELMHHSINFEDELNSVLTLSGTLRKICDFKVYQYPAECTVKNSNTPGCEICDFGMRHNLINKGATILDKDSIVDIAHSNNQTLESMLVEVPDEQKITALARKIEEIFILAPNTSGLEIIGSEKHQEFSHFKKWNYSDFPGRGGPHSRRIYGLNPDEASTRYNADRVFAYLSRVRPERRPNIGHFALVKPKKLGTSTWRKLAKKIKKSVTSFKKAEINGKRSFADSKFSWLQLHSLAMEGFFSMYQDASKIGIQLTPISSYRSAVRAAKNAAGAATSTKASRSVHTFGLAIDFQLSDGNISVKEINTRPFTNVLKMHRSKIYKYLLLRGEQFGWFPYQREPWHFEYNPIDQAIRSDPGSSASRAGFRKKFCEGIHQCLVHEASE